MNEPVTVFRIITQEMLSLSKYATLLPHNLIPFYVCLYLIFPEQRKQNSHQSFILLDAPHFSM